MTYARILVVAVAAVLPLVGLASPDAVGRGADALVRAQQDFEGSPASWSWRRGAKDAAPNTSGLVALGLVRTAHRAGSLSALEAAKAWGEARLADVDAWRPLYDPDVEALAALGEVTGDARYLAAAKTAFARRWSEARGPEAMGLLRMQRSERLAPVVGYDGALAIRAAVSVGDTAFAHELAGVLLADPSWKRHTKKDAQGFSTTARAAVLEALMILDAERYRSQAGRLAAQLAKAQAGDGSWASRNTQATAYAVSALARLRGPGSDQAVSRGQAWLRKTQLEDGSWASFHDGLPEPFVGDVVHEVTAEVLLALAAR